MNHHYAFLVEKNKFLLFSCHILYSLLVLNSPQKLAVETISGPLLIIAGAGSGKTRVLASRIAYLIEKGVKPWNILAVTFTNKAANEMKERVRKLLNLQKDGSLKVNMGTFHSICVKILRIEAHLLGYENEFTIYDSADSVALMKNIMNDFQIDSKRLNPKAILHAISIAKNQLITPEEYQNQAFDNFHKEVARLYLEYQKRLALNQAFDFDDLIMKVVEILKLKAEILTKYQEKFQYILVDEYQDTNQAQYVLVNLLAQKYKNLCVVGDSDQSIYSWRGANIQNILDFEKDYPEAKVIKLEQNYRSTKNILAAAHHVIVKSSQRKDKEMWTENDIGQKIKVLKAFDEKHEGELIANEIEKILRTYENPQYKDFVILYRTNAQSRVLEETLLRHGIPYRIVGGVKFYERKEIKDLIAYLRVIQNPSDSISLLRIINIPSRKIGATTLQQIQEQAFLKNQSFFQALQKVEFLPQSKQIALLNFVSLIQELQKENQEFSASGILKQVIQRVHYKEYLLSESTKEAESRFENVMELVSVASKYDGIEPQISLSTFLEEVSLISDLDNLSDQDNAVALMTLHSAKGLEFETVFIAGAEDGILPHKSSFFSPEEFEEERRLMYVGMTRAKENLYILHTNERMVFGSYNSNPPSQFINDIEENLLEFNYERGFKSFGAIDLGNKLIPAEDTFEVKYDFEKGDIIEHKIFGIGKIISVVGDIATVHFEDPEIGVKKLALNIAPI